MASETKINDVFISYADAQKTLADAVCATLEQNKIRCWIAPRDVLPGEPFAKAIIRAMNESRLFVLVFSAETNESNYVKNEVERAVSKGLSIIVFRVENVVPTEEMEFYLSRRHWLDAMTPPIEAHFQKLVEAVRALLAIPSLETALDESEQKVADLRMRARDAVAQADWAQALALLEQVEAVLPDDPEVAEMLQAVKRDQHLADLRGRGQERLEIHDWAGAIVLLEEASRLAPDDADLAASLSRAQRNQGLDDLKAQARRLAAEQDWQGVLVLLKQARELAPEDAEMQRLAAQATREQRIIELHVRARAAYSARQWQQALPLLEELRALTPDDTAARDMLAAATREEACQRQLGALVAHADTTAARAGDAARAGQWDAAERGWQDAVHAWGTAVTALEDHLAATPGDAVWRERMAEAQRSQKEAAQQADRLRSLAQRYADAQAALDAARPGQAVSLLSAVVDEAPAYRDAAELLRRAQRKVRGGRLRRSPALWLGAGALAVAGLVTVVFLSGLLPFPQRGAASIRATTLLQALTNQWVEAQIRGTGAAYGDCITARLTRRTRDILPLELPQGTLLLSKSSTVQDMVVTRVRAVINQDGGLTPTDTIRIADDGPQEYLLEAYGLDSRLEAPSVGAVFTVSGPADEAVQRTLQAATQLNPGGATQASAAVQMALWLLGDRQNRDGICLRLACKAEDLALAEQILAQAGFGPTPTPSAPPTTPTDTATSTLRPSATATAAPTTTATPTPRPTATATRTPAPKLVLLMPADGQIFTGRSTAVRLAWSPATPPLAANEYYLVTILFPHEQATWTDYQWTRTPELLVPGYLYDNVSGDRSFRWQVSLVRLNSGDPSGNPQDKTTLIVAPGAARTFRWLPEAEQPKPPPSPVPPTATPRPVEPTATPRPVEPTATPRP
jgi:hypothetical protein